MADTLKTITCLVCNNEMEKLYIKGTNFNIDICLNGCGGMFFDNRELEKFNKLEENKDKILQVIFEENLKEVLGENAGIKPQ